MGGGGGGSTQAAVYTQPGQNPSSLPGLPSEGIIWNSPLNNPGNSPMIAQQNAGNWQGWPGNYNYNLPQIKPPGQTYNQPAPPSPGLSRGGQSGSQNPIMAFNLGQMLGALLATGGGPFASGTQFPSGTQYPGPPSAGKSL